MKTQKNIQEENIIFALDIGTRSIVGILGMISEDMFSVSDYEQRFHQKRAMRDGQIEDIHLVVKTVKEVKDALEERSGIALTKVSIAAAGRSLKTMRTTFTQELNEEDDISAEQIHSIEYNAISLALDNFSKIDPDTENQLDSVQTDPNHFSCVGYNVISYELDGYPLANPLGHRGNLLKVELIAAFLPFSVVRSLYSVTELCGLTVESLTLEPIAAINAVVPPDIRLLNIAIADIGAGTSDIGISKNGSIVAYDMVTIAGDEITEIIMKEYLVDFNTAETIKFRLSEDVSEISFLDILGIGHTCSVESILKVIDETVELLSNSIVESIIKINDGPPTALFLVGGGSQIPNLCSRTAEKLNLPEQRVTLGGKYPYRNITLHNDSLLTPEYVTPLGIGATSRLSHIHDLFSVTVNGEKITLPGTETIKILDALLLAGIKASHLIGRSPSPLVYYLNGEKKTVRGTPPMPGELYVNKALASLDTPIRQGDSITVVFAQHGKKAEITLKEVCAPYDSNVTVNGKPELPDYLIQNGDQVEISYFSDEPLEELIEGPITPRVTETNHPRKVRVCVNSNWMEIPTPENVQLIFVDMLNYVDIDMKSPKGELILSINNQSASYTDPIMSGDSVEIRWSKPATLPLRQET